MPIYMFKCEVHGMIEMELGINDEKPTRCYCGLPLVRQFAVPNVVYKGDGFYSTDKVLYEHNIDDDDI